MGCESCSNGDGSPAGCRNNGNCGSSGCNKLEVFDWLAGMELPGGQSAFDIAEVRFKNNRKNFYRIPSSLEVFHGDVIMVEGSPGKDAGVVSLTGELVKIQMRKKGVKDNHELRKVIRKATDEDIEKWQKAKTQEWDTMLEARDIAKNLQLEMKISDVEYQGDRSKATFYYTAEGRVDFRELIKKLAETFRVRIEMKQIGMRQEAGRLGGIGSCGRELCCSTWLTDFRSVSTSAARYQQLALNPQKLAGQCGKLKCCLNYELDQYLEAVKSFPSANTKLETQKGRAAHFKTDIFKQMMFFIYEGQVGGAPIGLNVEAVHEIIEMNKNGKKPDSLQDYQEEVVIEVVNDYENVVGQDSLTRFDKKKPRRKKKRKGGGQNRPNNNPNASKNSGKGNSNNSGKSNNNRNKKRRKK
jgi:cell fate regulator YaaT (PSP1 superfamily)